MRLSFVLAAASIVASGSARADTGGAEEPYSHANDGFGEVVALSGSRLAVGVPGANAAGFDAGRVHVYALEDGAWQLEAQLDNPADAPARGYFGRSVALRGDTLVVGATIEDGLAAHFDEAAGSVHVYERRRGRWRHRARLRDASVDSDAFGRGVALSADAIAVVSDERVKDRAELPAIIAVYHRFDDGWAEAARLELPPQVHYPFVRLGEGTLVAALHGAGIGVAAYRREGEAWAADGSLEVAMDVEDLAIDGERLLVASARGGVAVFRDTGAAWELEQEFELGTSVSDVRSLALGGDLAAFGLDVLDPMSGDVREQVSVWRSGDEGWQALGEVGVPGDVSTVSPQFGDAVAVGGSWLAVGTSLAGEPEFEMSGLVHVFAAEGGPEVARLSPEDALDGCGCRSGGAGSGSLVAWLVILGVWRRRR